MIAPGERSPTAPTPLASEDRSARPSPAAPLLVWLVLQMAMLVLAAQRVPLSARFPQAGERLAVHEMLVAQIAASALLFPWLLRDTTTVVLVAASAVTFGQLAAHLAGVSYSRAAMAGAYVVVWIIGLSLWRPVLGRRRALMIGVAGASSLAIGGALLAYLRADATLQPAPWSSFGPIMGALAQIDRVALSPKSWIFLTGFLASSFIAMLIERRPR